MTADQFDEDKFPITKYGESVERTLKHIDIRVNNLVADIMDVLDGTPAWEEVAEVVTKWNEEEGPGRRTVRPLKPCLERPV